MRFLVLDWLAIYVASKEYACGMIKSNKPVLILWITNMSKKYLFHDENSHSTGMHLVTTIPTSSYCHRQNQLPY